MEPDGTVKHGKGLELRLTWAAASCHDPCPAAAAREGCQSLSPVPRHPESSLDAPYLLLPCCPLPLTVSRSCWWHWVLQWGSEHRSMDSHRYAHLACVVSAGNSVDRHSLGLAVPSCMWGLTGGGSLFPNPHPGTKYILAQRLQYLGGCLFPMVEAAGLWKWGINFPV